MKDFSLIANDADRFWNLVDRSSGDAGCWIWKGTKDKNGYGRFYKKIDKQAFKFPSHRVAYFFEHGECPSDKMVCHKCDTPSCVRPACLFLGTPLDNMVDMVQKGRQAVGLMNGKYTKPERTPRGEKAGCVTLTDAQVIEMRRRRSETGVSQQRLADEYGVRQAHVSRILRRKNWTHLP